MHPKNRPALILIDIQRAFEGNTARWGNERNNPEAERQAARLLAFWRQHDLPIFHLQHCSTEADSPLRPDQPGNRFQEVVAPQEGEPIIQKNVNSGFIGTNLKELLDEQGINQLVLAGLTTDHCVSTTTRMAGNFGYHCFLVSDATAAFDKGMDGKHYSAEMVHKISLATLKDEFAEVGTTEELLASLTVQAV